jgi:ssDNA thymidine ADP-ribosyltransferase, DarT
MESEPTLPLNAEASARASIDLAVPCECPRNAEKALIYRVTHRDNIPWILDNGLHCKSSPTIDPTYVDIGHPELIEKRSQHLVPCAPGGTLGDYVPFYFTPFSPMAFNIKTGRNGIRKRGNAELVLIVSSLHNLTEKKVPFLFTDRHAILAVEYYSDLIKLDKIDWSSLQQRNFRRGDPERFKRYQAEALVHKHLQIDAIIALVCYSDHTASIIKANIATRRLTTPVAKRPKWYFS